MQFQVILVHFNPWLNVQIAKINKLYIYYKYKPSVDT